MGLFQFCGCPRYLFWKHDNSLGRVWNLIGTRTGIFYPKMNYRNNRRMLYLKNNQLCAITGGFFEQSVGRWKSKSLFLWNRQEWEIFRVWKRTGRSWLFITMSNMSQKKLALPYILKNTTFVSINTTFVNILRISHSNPGKPFFHRDSF